MENKKHYVTTGEVIFISTIVSIIVWISCFFINYEIQKIRAEAAIIRAKYEMQRAVDSTARAQDSIRAVESYDRVDNTKERAEESGDDVIDYPHNGGIGPTPRVYTDEDRMK